ncbi:MAG TPA: TonB-dependent receptor, partial [Terriglobales bacterium]|nr:TonB-dependent receptor [Terriglobales bacterium]
CLLVSGLCLLLLALPRARAQENQLQGTVRDVTGAPIAAADVTLSSGGDKRSTQTDQNGRFSFPHFNRGEGTLSVSAPNFRTAAVPVAPKSNSEDVQVVLHPASINEQIIVSATRTDLPLAESPGSTIVFSQADLAVSPALAIDDVLRQVPGFSLFRRTDSRVANPTAQGVSLRGLGASGTSRALVLEDGIPLLDPFGGWVYWDRVPRAAVSTVEVFRGGASNLYGSDALGGVVQFITRQPDAPSVSVEGDYGTQNTPNLSFWTGTKAGAWEVDASADLFQTDGYILVPQADRGAIDVAANSKHASTELGVARKLGDGNLALRGGFFRESRSNGTPLQTNGTRIAEGAAVFNQNLGTKDSLSFRLYGDAQHYDQNFSAIALDRMSESLTNIQKVPAQELGFDGQWTHLIGKSQTIIAGVNLLEVMGTSEEQIFSSGLHIANSVSGGRQRTAGVFAEDVFRIGSKWTLIAAGRFDHWGNFRGVSFRTPLTSSGVAISKNFPDRTDNFFSPRVSLIRSLNRNLTATASIYRAFRAPTLNELYRSFRLGSILTQNNAALRAETLTGGEAGLTVSTLEGKFNVRGTFFWSQTSDPVANVTLSVTPTLITRQRQNLGETRSRGVELDAVARLSNSWQLSGGYAFTDSTVLDFPADTTLEGLRVPQVPQHQFTSELRYFNPSRLIVTLQGRFVGQQFDDDQNLLPLGNFGTMNLLLAREFSRGVQGFLAFENLLNTRYAVGRTPVPTLGPPILFRVGIRLDYPSRK